MPQKHYAVAEGRNPGVYDNWNDAKAQTDRYSGNNHKSFRSLDAAADYVAQQRGPSSGGYTRVDIHHLNPQGSNNSLNSEKVRRLYSELYGHVAF